jgi:hypothetical protein
MLAADVGCEERGANGEPTDAVAGQEVVVGGSFFAGVPEPDREDNQEVGRNDDGVEHEMLSVQPDAARPDAKG